MDTSEKTLSEIAQLVGGKIVGDGSVKISGVTSIEYPKPGCLSFLTDGKKLAKVEQSEIAAFLVPEGITSHGKPLIQVKQPKAAWALIAASFHPPRQHQKKVAKEAMVARTARIGRNVTIEPYAHIGENVAIGDGAVIRAHAVLDDDSSIGTETVIHPHAVIYPKTQIGNRVIIHAGAVIGADGFGYVFDGEKQVKVPQTGNVVIEDDVEIGACTTIDRATVGSTIIREGVKIDNLVQIAHNVEVGKHSCISAQSGISGSSKIGNYVIMGGGVGLADHVEIGDQAMLGAQTGVPPGKKIPPKQMWIGAPARPYEEMRKQVSAQLRSHETQRTVQELKKRIEALEREIQDLKSEKKVET